MSPEQRAAKIAKVHFSTLGTAWSLTAERDIARAIRAAENAALEEAAKAADEEYQHQLDQRGPHVAFIMEPVAAAIRALKSRAPRARRKS